MDDRAAPDPARVLDAVVAAIQRADCTIPRERAVAMAWTLRPDLMAAGPIPTTEPDTVEVEPDTDH